jgi:hypothetical protein
MLGTITFDCADVATMHRFWTIALDYGDGETDPDALDAFFDTLRRAGVPEQDLMSRAGTPPPPDQPGSPFLYFQRVPEPKTSKNRVHLDIVVHDPEAKARELAALGATRPERPAPTETDAAFCRAFDTTGDGWILMLDPEGNELCIGPRTRKDTDSPA